MSRARCAYCNTTRPLDDHGRVAAHNVTINVTRTAVRTVGVGRVRRRCSGSGRPPREVTR